MQRSSKRAGHWDGWQHGSIRIRAGRALSTLPRIIPHFPLTLPHTCSLQQVDEFVAVKFSGTVSVVHCEQIPDLFECSVVRREVGDGAQQSLQLGQLAGLCAGGRGGGEGQGTQVSRRGRIRDRTQIYVLCAGVGGEGRRLTACFFADMQSQPQLTPIHRPQSAKAPPPPSYLQVQCCQACCVKGGPTPPQPPVQRPAESLCQ